MKIAILFLTALALTAPVLAAPVATAPAKHVVRVFKESVQAPENAVVPSEVYDEQINPAVRGSSYKNKSYKKSHKKKSRRRRRRMRRRRRPRYPKYPQYGGDYYEPLYGGGDYYEPPPYSGGDYYDGGGDVVIGCSTGNSYDCV